MIVARQWSLPSWCSKWPIVVTIVLGSVLGLSASAQNAQGASNDLIARRIIAAWTKRQDTIRTVRAEVATDLNVKSQSISASRSTGPASYSRSDVTTVILDFPQNRQRYELRGGIYHATLGRVVETEKVTVVRDGKWKNFSNSPAFPELGISAKGQGLVYSEEDSRAHSMLHEANIMPLVWYIRPLGMDLPGMEKVNPRDLQVIGTSRTNGPQLIECSLSGIRIWVDPLKSYSIVRKRTVTQETTVTYTIDEQYGAVPKEWAVVRFLPDGTVRLSWSCRLQKLELNEPMDSSIFELTFPEGAAVLEVGGGVNATMVATGKGGVRHLDSHEQSVTRNTWRWFLWGNVLVVLMLGAFLLHRKMGHAT